MSVAPDGDSDAQIQHLMEECGTKYAKGDFLGTITLLEKAWTLLPGQKEVHPESFHLAQHLAEISLEAGNNNKARYWSNILFKCDRKRIDCGERDFVAGKVAFFENAKDEAWNHFNVANKKSKGCCFEDEDPKYRKFFLREKPGGFGSKLRDRIQSVLLAGNSLGFDIDGEKVTTELDDTTYAIVEALSNEGNALIEEERFDAAVSIFRKALRLIPDPKSHWEASTWLYVALGDAYFFQERYAEAGEEFLNAANCPEGNHNPFILLRLGQCLLEEGDSEKAKDFLFRAYMAEGRQIFEGEDAKYFKFIEQYT